MRLLRTDKLKLVEFLGDDLPPYAILSHMWAEEEVSFQDVQQGVAETRRGHAKLAGACAVAIQDGFEFIWTDTCCIDKSSSAELSEAINSMFRYYSDAEVCYAFLSDVDPDVSGDSPPRRFEQSRWFTRGWTLQELIAPGVVEFYNSKWESIGSRETLLDLVIETTNISASYFATGDLTKFSAAQKMSWAAGRETTRSEDVAYSLLGLFDINMPLLYGEGDRAFLRLQEEILRQHGDDSIFSHSGFDLLASSPWWFRSYGESGKFESWRCNLSKTPLATNRSVEINRNHISMVFPVVRVEESHDDIVGWYDGPGADYLALLACDALEAVAPLVLREEVPGIFSRRSVPRRTLEILGTRLREALASRVELRMLCIAHESWGSKGEGIRRWRWKSNMSWEEIEDRMRANFGKIFDASEPAMNPITRPALADGVVSTSQEQAVRNKVVVKGPSAATGFQVVYVCEERFRATWPRADDELHLIPDMTSNDCLLFVIFSDPGGAAFMVTLEPTRASINAGLWTDIPPWEGQNPGRFINKLNAARAGLGACSGAMQHKAGGGWVEVRVESRRRSDGWWVYVTAIPPWE